MKDYPKAIYYLLAFHFFIVIGAGHSIGILGFLEIFMISDFNFNEITFNLHATYDDLLPAISLISIAGSVLLLFSTWVRNAKTMYGLRVIAIILLWLGFFYLTHSLSRNQSAQIGFYSGLPFLFLSLFIFAFSIAGLKTIKRKHQPI